MDDQAWLVRMKKARREEQASGAGLVKEKDLLPNEDYTAQDEACPTGGLQSTQQALKCQDNDSDVCSSQHV